MHTRVHRFSLAGIAKGAGMIHPNMATMLCILATDAAVAPKALDAALRYAADRSFNAISIDGDSSTNDSVYVLANGAAGRLDRAGWERDGRGFGASPTGGGVVARDWH